jgi:ribose transport system permease protein
MNVKAAYRGVREHRFWGPIVRFLAENSVIVAFAAMVIIATILAGDSFMSQTNIINILRTVSIIGIISLGMTLIIISGGIDLSVGSALVLVGAAGIWVLNETRNIPLGLLTMLAGGLAVGLINGTIITRGRVTPFIATLGVMATCRSLSLYLLNGGGISASLPEYWVISNGDLLGISFPVIYFVLLTVMVFVFSQKTPLGRYIYSIGSNEKASHLSAINVNRVKVITYMIGGAMVAVASMVETSRLNSVSAASSGQGYELDAIAAVIIGGTRMSGGRGSVVGTFFGVLILGILNNMLTLMGVSPFVTGTVKGIIIIVAVLVQKKE